MIVRGPSSRNDQQATDQTSQNKGQSVVDSLKLENISWKINLFLSHYKFGKPKKNRSLSTL